MDAVLIILGLFVAFYAGTFIEQNRRKVEDEQVAPPPPRRYRPYHYGSSGYSITSSTSDTDQVP